MLQLVTSCQINITNMPRPRCLTHCVKLKLRKIQTLMTLDGLSWIRLVFQLILTKTTAYKNPSAGVLHTFKERVNKMLPQIYRRTDIEKQFGISRSTIYAMMAEGRFPKPVKLADRAVGWLEEDLKNWFDNMQETK